MSINWVMLSEDKRSFTPLPGEQPLYKSPPRTALTLKSLSGYPGNDPFSIECSGGIVHLTNRRIVYLPTDPNPKLESFAAPILNLHDTHVAAPWFGANIWTALVQPVPGGNIPSQCQAVELKMTFKDGGAFDFHSTFERIKERVQQAVEVARESGQLYDDGFSSGGRASNPLNGVNLDNVHLDELPAYEATSTSPLLNPSSRDTAASARNASRPQESNEAPPSEPPRYEEVQRESVADELERRLRTGQ